MGWAGGSDLDGPAHLPGWLEIPIKLFGTWMIVSLLLLMVDLVSSGLGDECSTQSCRGVRRDSHGPLRRKGLPHVPVGCGLGGKLCRIIGYTLPDLCPPVHWN